MPFLGKEPAFDLANTSDLGDSIVTEAKMADDAIGLPELKSGTDGELITWDASGNPTTVGAGTSGHFLKSQGAGSVPVFAAVSAGFTHATPQSGSGTSLTFGSIPAGTSLIVLTMHDFSTNGGDEMMVQIGDSGGIETADYRSQRSNNANGSLGSDGTPNSNESQGFGITLAAGNTCGGQMILSLHHPTNHTWTSSSSFRVGSFDHSWGAGSKDLSAELTQVRITTKGGSETFDAGTINIMYM